MGEQNEVKPVDLTSDKAKKDVETTAVAEKAKETAPDEREAALTRAKEQMRRDVRESQGQLNSAGNKVDEATQRYLEEYFQGAINRFDKDKDNKISADEAKAFKISMLAKTSEIISSVTAAGKAEKKMNAAAEKAQEIDIKTASASIEGIAELGELGTDLEKANQSVSQLEAQNQAFTQIAQQRIAEVQTFSASYAEFQKAKEGFSHFSALWDSMVNGDEWKEKVLDLQQKLDTNKTAVAGLITQLKAKQKILDANGEAIKKAFIATREAKIKEREEKKAEIEQYAKEHQDQLEERKKQYDQLEQQRKKMETQRNSIAEREKKAEEFKNNWQEKDPGKRVPAQKAALEDQGKDIEAELGAFDLLLGHPDVTEDFKKALQPAYEAAKTRARNQKLTLDALDRKGQFATEFTGKLDDEHQKAQRDLQNSDAQLQRQTATAQSLETNIHLLGELQLNYATEGKQVEECYNRQIDGLDKQMQGVEDFVLNSSVARQQSIVGLENAQKSLGSMQVSGFVTMNPVELFGSMGKGIGSGLHDLAKGIDAQTRDILNNNRDSDKLSYYAMHFTSVFTGFASGALEMGGGIFSLTGGVVSDIGSIGTGMANLDTDKMHFDTFKGLGAMVGYDAATGDFTGDKFKETWTMIGSAIVGYGENWGYYENPETGKLEERSEYGTAAGKTLFNALSVIATLGAGAGMKGASAAGTVTARTSGLLGKAALKGGLARNAVLRTALSSGKSTSFLTGRGAQVAAFTRALRPAFVQEAANAAKVAAAKGSSKSWAVAKSVAGSAYKGGAEAAGTVARGIGSLRRTPTLKLAGQAVRGTVRGVGQGIKWTSKAVLEIGLAPYRMTWSLAKSIRYLGRGNLLRAAHMSSRMGQAQNIIEKNSARYAESMNAIERIIMEDGALAKEAAALAKRQAKSKNIKGTQLEVELNQLALERTALEAKAATRLAETDPALAAVYDEVQKASRTMTNEAETYIAATEKNIKKVIEDKKIKADFDEYQRLMADSKAPGANAPSNPAKGNLAEFEKDASRLHNARRYEAAEQASKELADLRARTNSLQTDPIGRHSDEAFRLVDEVQEARAATAPADSELRFNSNTNSPEFARDFIKKYDEAYAAKGSEGVTELVNSLGIRRADSPLAKYLDDLGERQVLLRDLPEPAILKKIPDKLRREITDEFLNSKLRNDSFKYVEMRTRYSKNPHYKEVFDWMEEVYKKHPDQAGFIINPDPKAFSEALLANQRQTASVFEKYNQLIEKGEDFSKIRAEMVRDGLNQEWQSALTQIHQRFTLRNRQLTLSADTALNRLRSEYAQVTHPEMTGAEAARVLERRYRRNNTGQTAVKPEPRVVAERVKFKDGEFDIRVADDGAVRLYKPGTDNIVLPESAWSTFRGRPRSQPATPAQPTAAPAPAPTAAATPAQVPKSSPAYRRMEAYERDLTKAIADDTALQALDAGGPMQKAIARTRAEIKLFEPTKQMVEARLKDLTDDISNLRSNGPAQQKARAALDAYKKTPDYLRYQQFQQAEAAANSAAKALEKVNPANTRLYYQHIQEARIQLIRNRLVKRIEGEARITPEEVANLLEREKVPTLGTRDNIGVLNDNVAKTTINGKPYTIKLLKNGEFRLFDDAGQSISSASAARTAPAATPAATPATPATTASTAPTATPTPAAARTSPSAAPSTTPTPRTSPSATPSPAPANYGQIMRDARASLQTSGGEIVSLDGRIAALENRIEALRFRYGETSPQVTSQATILKKLNQQRLQHLDTVKIAQETISSTRGLYWKNRLVEVRDGIKQTVNIPARLTWLKNRSSRLGAIAQKSVDAVRALSKPTADLISYLQKQVQITSVAPAKILLMGRTGTAIADRMDVLRAASVNRYPDVAPLLAELSLDQYRILAAIDEGSAISLDLPPEEEFAQMSPEEQTKTLRAAYGQLEAGDSLDETSLLYTAAQKTYITEKRQLVMATLTELESREDLTPEAVNAALDEAFGPQGSNDSQAGYEIATQGLTIKVDKNGNRTYEGTETWVAKMPTRKAFRGIIEDVQKEFAAMTPAELTKANKGQPVETPEDFQKLVTARLQEKALETFKDQPMQMDLVAESTTIDDTGKPMLAAHVNATGQMAFTVDSRWSSEILQSINTGANAELVAAQTPTRLASASSARESAETDGNTDYGWDPDNPYS